VRLLLDHNIPPQAIGWLSRFDVDCLHVRDLGMITATDHQLWQFAKRDGRVIVTKDGDFAALARSNPALNAKVIWLRIGNMRNRDLEPWLIGKWPRVRDLLGQGHSIIEVR
jgi:predicted nuclease of predicted toxin-antitoxin system